jgi:lipoprotein-anchoring transpeptidase ErfK/SrfK
MTEDSKMKRANALRSSAAAGVLLRIAALGIAGAVGSVVPASAAFYYSYSPDSGYYSEQQIVQPPHRQQHPRRASAKKKETKVKDTTVHPQLPLIINVSIARQRVRVFDANGFFAEAPVSTGMPGHATPMGVFSVIQKDRYHHSNIYSGAPMPFMQRITWEGVALHAGVLPGYPASHGCIRMPEAFAIKMWGWTKMGARVIVTPGELPAPENFEHPLLPAMKVVPQPAVAQQPETNEPLAAKADKGEFDIKPIETSLELRSTVGHGEPTKPQDEAVASDQTHTADASSATTANSDESKPESAKPDSTKPADAKPEAATVEPAKGDARAKPAVSADTAKPDDKVASADKPADAAATPDTHSAPKPDQADAAAKPTDDAAKSADVKPVEAKADTPAAAAKPDTAKPDAAKADQANPADAVKAADAAPPSAKDQTRMTDTSKPAAKPAKKREGQIAVFISRKDSKIYVRQNFAPLFESPVTIAPSDRPLGTHVFTAEVDKNDSNLLHWSVVNVPMSARAMMRDGDGPRLARHRKGRKPEPVADVKPVPLPDSPSEALDRITIPPEVMARITDALTTGASIVVSDQGIAQGDTGEGTDFILSLR